MVEETSLARFALWVVAGAIVGLVSLIFGVPAVLLAVPTLLLLVGGAVVAGSRPRRGTALGGYLVGLALPVGWVGLTVGAVDRVCTSGGIDVDGVEFCTVWEPTGSIRWPWFLAAGALAVLGALLQLRARRREVRTWGAPTASPA
jgi:hypothetical protein